MTLLSHRFLLLRRGITTLLLLPGFPRTHAPPPPIPKPTCIVKPYARKRLSAGKSTNDTLVAVVVEYTNRQNSPRYGIPTKWSKLPYELLQTEHFGALLANPALTKTCGGKTTRSTAASHGTRFKATSQTSSPGPCCQRSVQKPCGPKLHLNDLPSTAPTSEVHTPRQQANIPESAGGFYANSASGRTAIAEVLRSGVGTRDDVGEFRAMASHATPREIGVGFPPFHGLCWGTTVAVV